MVDITAYRHRVTLEALPAAFHTRDGMFDHYPYTGDDPIQEPLTSAQVPAPGGFFGCRVSVPGGS